MKNQKSTSMIKLKHLFTFASVLFFLTAFAMVKLNSVTDSPLDKEIITGPEDWKDYKNWTKITKEPNTGDPTGFLDKKHGGEGAFRDVYVNKVGEAVMTGQADFPYPTGTVIVKEAFKNKKNYDAQKGPELTVMIKLEAGSAPDTNDWEFFMGASGKQRGKGMDTKWGKFCGSCHLNATAKDFTFMASDR